MGCIAEKRRLGQRNESSGGDYLDSATLQSSHLLLALDSTKEEEDF